MLRTLKSMLTGTLVDRIIGCGEDSYNSLIAAAYPGTKLLRLDNGIDFSRLDKAAEDGKKQYGLEDKRVCTIFASHFFRKGADIALKAVSQIADTHAIVLCLIVHNEVDCSVQVEAVLGSVPQWVRILPVREDVQFYYNMSDIFLSPSRSEGLCYAIAEAAYCCTPVIVSDAPGLDWGIPESITVPQEDAQALRNAILQLLAQTESRSLPHILTERKTYVETHCGLTAWVQSLYACYESVLKNHKNSFDRS